MKQLKNVTSTNVKEEIVVGEIEQLLPVEFVDQLNSEDGISSEYLETSAPWLKLKGETEEEYQLYLIYQGLPQHTWNLRKVFHEFDLYFNSETVTRVSFNKFKVIAEKNHWHVRRYANILYNDWLIQQEDMRQQLMMIADYRRNQSELAKKATEASLVLMDKLTTKINSIDFDDIRTVDIPKFLSAVKEITAMAADSEARLLSINMLLDLHSKEIAEMFEQDTIEIIT